MGGFREFKEGVKGVGGGVEEVVVNMDAERGFGGVGWGVGRR